MDRQSSLWTGIAVAALLWFYMFSPWTSGVSNFWLNMSISATILCCFVIFGRPRPFRIDLNWKRIVGQFLLGCLIAFALWGVFYIGDKLSQLMFGFARTQVDNVYGMKEGTSPVLIAVLLLVLIGPAEELFWRGYVQRTMSGKLGADKAMFITLAVYALIHIWSFNFMLVMAALVAGAVWGLLYRFKPSMLPALVVSHALWDALVFIIIPI